MRAVVLTGTGGPEVLQVQERPDPAVGRGQIRVAVRAAGINFADTLARIGLYPDAPKPPCVLGYEVAGEVESVGEGVTDFRVGDRVVAGTRFGGQAELVSVDAAQALLLPDHLSFEQGAAFPVNYGTAYAALILMGSLREGDRVLIHAAGGGVGISATQIARNVGAEVFGTASPGKHEAIRAQGVTHAIDYRNQDFETEVMRITGGEGVDLIMDALGPTSFRKDYRLLRSGGRLVMYGLSENSDNGVRNIPATLKSLAKMPLATMPWWKSLMMMNENKGVFGLNMLSWWDREGDLDRVTEPLMADLEAGRLEPVVAEAFPFDRAGEAHEFIAQRRNVGKVVLFP
jgi:NADPH:quinone reductase-like Zn-dependent oxidoreductase